MTKVCVALFISLVNFVAVSNADSAAMQTMLDIMAGFSTGGQYPRDYLGKLHECWDSVDPTMGTAHNRIWQAFLNYSKTAGNPDGTDVWTPTLGCNATGMHDRQPWFEKNLSFIGGARNISICEPCNFNSNLAFYRTSTRLCDHDKERKWLMSDEMKRAVVRAAASQATGSAFMHGSETDLGNAFDTRGQAILPLLSHQMAIAQLPAPFNTSTVLRDFSLTAGAKTGIEQQDILQQTILTLPAEKWLPVMEANLDGDLTRSLAPIIGSILSLLLPDSVVDEICDLIAKFMGGFSNPKDILFLKDHYLPMFRNATAKLLAKMGPLKKLEVAKVGLGGWTKFLYYTLWQEQIIKAKVLLDPWVNQAGAELMPKVFALADTLSGFSDTDSVVEHCGADVYPGAGWCRLDIPHAKSHEIAANAFYDLVALGDWLGRLYRTEDHELVAFEAESQLSDNEYGSKVMLLESITASVTEIVHSASMIQSRVQQQAEEAHFWRTIAAATSGLLVLSLIFVAFLGCKLWKLRQILGARYSGQLQCPHEAGYTGRYTKLVDMP